MKITTLIYRSIIAIWNVAPFRRQAAFLIRFCRLPIAKLYQDLWFEGPFKVSFENKSLKLYASRYDSSTLSIFWDGLKRGWDAQSLHIWSQMAKNSKVILDIGANIGLYALIAKKVNPDSSVFAFEPGKQTVEILKKNVESNGLEISVFELALSNTTGLLDFFDLPTPTAVSSLKKNENLSKQQDLVKYKVDVTTFESFVKEKRLDNVDLISIDVEMNEPEVLEGMGDYIRKYHPNFIIEVLNNDIGAKIETFFEGLNYSYYAIDEQHGLTPSSHIYREEEKQNGHSGFNFLICNRNAIEKLNLNQSKAPV